MEWLFDGVLGSFWVSLSFAAALVGAVASGQALVAGPQQTLYRRMGFWAFGVHALSVVMILVTLMGLILTHRYEYHYVWSHSSNELPVYYVVACLWEGQEGSFLVWMLWHALLGTVVACTAGPWRSGVLAVLCSVQVLLSSMLLGIYLPQSAVAMSLGALGLVVLADIGYFQRQAGRDTPRWVLALGLLLAALVTLYAALPGDVLPRAARYGLLGLSVGVAGYALWAWGRMLSLGAMASLLVLACLGGALVWAGPGGWEVGSSPFLLLRDAFPEAEAYRQDPAFVPVNGKGLNPLLQNYWMVIHPPTLFLGFAATLIPFAFLVSGLLSGQYTAWVRPASAWTLFSAMILGVGIIMGGYWAYETLNFGGYWNWDPVENASFVPWLTAVASLHGLVLQRRGRRGLGLTAVLITSTFLLVLYSTFLTRSGILGDSSVHSFTDLGLSGQLLVLLLSYVLLTVLLLADRWPHLQQAADAQSPGPSKVEFYLLAGILVLVFAALHIGMSTSLPVFNKILGTTWAPPAKAGLYYYQWNIGFGLAVLLLTGMGQYFYWTRLQGERLSRALFRPFVLAAILGVAVMGLLAYLRWEFAWHQRFSDAIRQAEGWQVVPAFLGQGLLLLSDDLLLILGLFTLLANGDILLRLLRRNRRHLSRMGGGLAHIGFGLMLLGILFSSGYERTVSINLKPHLLGNAFPEEGKKDNVLLIKDQPEVIMGYRVRYTGKLQAEAPLRDLAIVTQDAEMVKFRFRDRQGYTFSQALPRSVFEDIVRPAGQTTRPATPDLEKLRDVLEKNLPILQPRLLNDRTLYGLEFRPLEDSSQRFVLYPEAEVNENMGLVAHPDRHITLGRDLYVHVTSIPADEKDPAKAPKAETLEHRLAIGDTLRLKRSTVVLEKLVRVSEVPEYKDYSLAVRLKLKVLSHKDGRTYAANPTLLVDAEGQTAQVDDAIPPVGCQFSFLGADPAARKVVLATRETEERPDYLTFKAITKPLINLLWLGTFILTAGFLMAIVRRVQEQRRTRSSARDDSETDSEAA